MSDDRHKALKRWERAQQMSVIRAEPELSGPFAFCRINSPQGPERIPVYVVSLFTKDLVCVKSSKESVPEGVPGQWWLVRGGINWDAFLRSVVRHYTLGLPVPTPFKPSHKIAADIVSHLQALPDSALVAVFNKMRETGLLPALPVLSKETCPHALPWENIRAFFQDFQNENQALNKIEIQKITDNPPP